jgi:hypothetical protein
VIVVRPDRYLLAAGDTLTIPAPETLLLLTA